MPRAKTRAAVAPVVEDDAIEELDDLEELDDAEEVEEPTPAKKTAKKTAPAAKATPKAAAPVAERSEFDSTWLAEHISEETGVEYDSRAVRMLLRKLAKDGQLEREIGTDRSRYVFPKGANDPIVKQVIKLVKTGADKAIKNESLNDIKAKKAAEKAAADSTPKKTPTKAQADPAKKAATGRRATR